VKYRVHSLRSVQRQDQRRSSTHVGPYDQCWATSWERRKAAVVRVAVTTNHRIRTCPSRLLLLARRPSGRFDGASNQPDPNGPRCHLAQLCRRQLELQAVAIDLLPTCSRHKTPRTPLSGSVYLIEGGSGFSFISLLGSTPLQWVSKSLKGVARTVAA